MLSAGSRGSQSIFVLVVLEPAVDT